MTHHLSLPVPRGRLLLALIAGIAVLLTMDVPPAAAQAYVPRPHCFATPSADGGSWFVQVAARTMSGRAGDTATTTINGAEFKLAHVDTHPPPGRPDSAYAYAVSAFTTTGYCLQVGYLRLQSDGGDVGRLFMQALSPTGATVYWNLSRAGTTNRPPANSASSGDAGHGGYPFALTMDANGTLTYWFDGLVKGKVSLGAANRTLDLTRGVAVTGELTARADVTGAVMGPRTVLRTRLWSNTTQTWGEPTTAAAAYYPAAPGTGACPYGVTAAGPWEERYPPAAGTYHQVTAGSGVACTPAGTVLWP